MPSRSGNLSPKMSDFITIAFSTLFFWLITFCVAYAHEHATCRPLVTKLVDAVLLSVLLTIPVFLFICHNVLVICWGCNG